MKITALRMMLAALVLVALGGACSKEAAAELGEPGDAADVDQVIEIDMTDQLRFDPSEIDVAAGDTVEFRLTNVASSPHEFVLGPTHEHSDDMQHAEENSTGAIEAGGTASVIWSFPEAGEAAFACYIDGHNEAGMTGTVTVSE